MVGVPYENPTRYVGPARDLIPIVKVPRIPTSTDKKYPLGQFWIIGDDPTTGVVGALYYLCDFVAGVPTWCQVSIGAGATGIDGLVTDDGLPSVVPDGMGDVGIAGGIGLTTSGQDPATTVTIDLDVPVVVANGGTGLTSITDGGLLIGSGTGAITVTAQPTDGQILIGQTGNDPALNTITAGAGVTVTNGPGTITLSLSGGGAAVDEIGVDGNTGPGTDPVVSTAAGLVTVSGNTVANATNAKPIFTHSRAANTYNIEAQVGAAISAAPGDKNDAGLLSLDSADFTVDTDGFAQLNTGLKASITVNGGAVINIGFTLSTQTLTVHSADGTALSSTNPGYILVEDPANANQMKVFTVTSNQSMLNTEMNGNTFGTTASTAWSSALPLFLYAMTNDTSTSIQFSLGRIPHLGTSPAAAIIGDPSAANADQEYSLYSLDDITEADWDANPVACIGSLRATKDASDIWSFTTMDNSDGIGKFNSERMFDFPEGQFGSSSGSYILANGGTAPTFTSQTFDYGISKNGQVHSSINLFGNSATDGAGAVTAFIPAPYKLYSSTDASRDIVLGTGKTNSAGLGFIMCTALGTTGTDRNIRFVRSDAATYLQNGSFSNADRSLFVPISYKAYNGNN